MVWLAVGSVFAICIVLCAFLKSLKPPRGRTWDQRWRVISYSAVCSWVKVRYCCEESAWQVSTSLEMTQCHSPQNRGPFTALEIAVRGLNCLEAFIVKTLKITLFYRLYMESLFNSAVQPTTLWCRICVSSSLFPLLSFNKCTLSTQQTPGLQTTACFRDGARPRFCCSVRCATGPRLTWRFWTCCSTFSCYGWRLLGTGS